MGAPGWDLGRELPSWLLQLLVVCGYLVTSDSVGCLEWNGGME